jgi:hypothetical protein
MKLRQLVVHLRMNKMSSPTARLTGTPRSKLQWRLQ